jgi:hypothetical protein
MLNEREVYKKLQDYAAAFNVHITGKRYAQAKHYYDVAREVAVFMELDEGKKRELFGERGNRGEIIEEGLFKEEKVQKAYLESCVKARDMGCTRCEKQR